VIDPDEHQLDIYAPNGSLKKLSTTDTLTLPDILPDFSVLVVELFG
jgi:Uma2 family endonuclease